MSCTCSACREDVTPIRPTLGAQLAFWSALGTTILGLVLCPFLGFALFTLAPVIVLFGLAIGPLADDAFAPALCPACSRRFVPVEEAPEEARVIAVAGSRGTTTMRA